MSSFSAPFAEPRRYGLKWYARALFLFLAALGIGVGFTSWRGAIASRGGPAPILWVFVAAETGFGLYFLLSAFTWYVQLDNDSVSAGGFFRTRTLRYSAVKGRRRIYTRHGSYHVIEGRTPQDKPLSISNYFDVDGVWTAWIQRLPDLDLLDRKAVLNTIAGSRELGATPQARLGRLKQAKTTAIVLSIVSVAVALAVFLFRQSLSPAVFGLLDLALVLLPWTAILLLARSPLLYRFLGARQDPRPTLVAVLLAPGFGLLASRFPNLQSAAPQTQAGYACIPGLLLALALFTSSAFSSQKKVPTTARTQFAAVILLLLTGGLYGFGLVQQINTQLDNSPMQPYAALVLRNPSLMVAATATTSL